jgi:hypothetical protein
MCSAVVNERRRADLSAEQGGDRAGDEEVAPAASERVPRSSDARFVGNAMRSLLQSADVSIARGDETRVLSRAQEALLQVEERSAVKSQPPAAQPPAAQPGPAFSTDPPGPRVDAVLWVVLALGLFAIAGWMIAYGL